MNRKELLSIPEGALRTLCLDFDNAYGEYPDPRYPGAEVVIFYNEEIKKLAELEKNAELVEELAMLEHKRLISQRKKLIKAESISRGRAAFWDDMNIPYGMLSEEIKDAYRKKVYEVLHLIKRYKK